MKQLPAFKDRPMSEDTASPAGELPTFKNDDCETSLLS
ncbi:hypothetical protein PLANPX_3803 [Lacipirellula parvula]|uniref:Uncharacterized protein n=1 Tax=Lacipirellula parvula TaxID=2650471 RepID=A0A5K7XGX6_9BACT|nr:hypothetical protein PLANPX_3803 [Lacipirellula parvula]